MKRRRIFRRHPWNSCSYTEAFPEISETSVIKHHFKSDISSIYSSNILKLLAKLFSNRVPDRRRLRLIPAHRIWHSTMSEFSDELTAAAHHIHYRRDDELMAILNKHDSSFLLEKTEVSLELFIYLY
jgi:hypothetical protein